MLNREQFLAQPLRTEKVDLPNGESSMVRELTAEEYANWVARWVTRDNGETKIDNRVYAASLLVLCVVDEQGQRVFQDGDEHVVLKMPAALVRALTVAAERLNGVAPEAVRDARKN